MFNIGTIGATVPSGPVIQLTGNSRAARVQNDWFYFHLNNNGTLYMSLGDTANSGVAQYVPGEWVKSGATAAIGSAYEAMLSPSVATGWAASGGGPAIGTWRAISSATDYYKSHGFVAGETFTVSIRESATGTVVTTATYTFAP